MAPWKRNSNSRCGTVRERLLEGALLAIIAGVRPIVEDEDCTVGEARPEVAQAIECGKADTAIVSHGGDFFDDQRFGAAQTLFKESFDQLEPKVRGGLICGNLLD